MSAAPKMDAERVLFMLTQTKATNRRWSELEPRIVVQSQGHIGGTPTVALRTLGAGIDWDAGKLLLYPEKPLTTLTEADLRDIRASLAKGHSWHAYREHQAQQRVLHTMQAEIDRLRALVPPEQVHPPTA